MNISISITLLMFSAVSIFLGISFFIYNKKAGTDRWLVMLYCLFGGLWCLNYGAIGFIEHLNIVWIVRLFGLISIDCFLIADFLLVSKFAKSSKRTKVITRSIFVILAVIDIFTFGQKDANMYVQIGNWTTWYPNNQMVHRLHSCIVGIFFIMMFMEGLVWLRNNNLKRQKKFIFLMFVSNFIMIFASIPDTFMTVMGYYALPTSGIGAGICTIVVWIGAQRLNAFHIEVGNVTSNIYDFINVGILVFDTEKKPVLANPFARQLLGILDNELLPFEELFCSEGEDTDCSFVSLDVSEYARLRSRRTGVGCKTSTTLANDIYGQPYCYIVAVYDMTKEDLIMGDLQRAMEAKMDFLASMSHEIRTPINSVLGFNELIGRETTQDQIKEYSANIQNAGVSLLGIISDILDMSKLESNQLDIHPQVYETAEMFTDCCNLFRIKAKEKGLAFDLMNDPAIPRKLIGDELRIRQIITNIVGNAIKYTPSGSVRVTVSFEKIDLNLVKLIVSVKDTGIGIEEDQLPYIFDSFKRIEETKNRHIEGSGLGLTITKRLVEKMNGSILVESTYGKGTEFTIILIQEVADISPCNDMALYASAKQEQYVPSFENDQFRVLVVDDNSMNLKLFCKLLAPTKLPVDMAEDGEAALQLIYKNHYDIIFMDHMMPKMDGVEALRQMRLSKAHPNQNTPVIMLTANALAGARATYRDAGFSDFLAKPFTGDELETMIRKYLPVASRKDEKKEGPGLLRGLLSIPEISGDVLLKNLPDEEMQREVLLTFVEEKDHMSKILVDAFEQIQAGDTKGFSDYRIQVHALKNNFRIAGAMELGDLAYELELAAKEENAAIIVEKHHGLMEQYLSFVDALQSVLQEGSSQSLDKEKALAILEELKVAMENFDVESAYELAEKLRPYPGTEKLLDAVRDLAQDAFEEACHEFILTL